jgi:hypothetical protein
MEQEQFVDPGRAMGFFRQMEERLLHPEVRSSGDEMSRQLADDFIEFGSSDTIYNKQQIIGSLAREQMMSGLSRTSPYECSPTMSFCSPTVQPGAILPLPRNGVLSEVQSGSCMLAGK